MDSTLLVLQHIACEPPALYEDIAAEHGLGVHRVELDEGEPLPDSLGFAAVIAMGGPMGATDDADHPWLAGEREYIARAVGAGLPFWGVCLGAQLLAASLGAPIRRGPEPEVGMGTVRLTADAAEDPVFGSLPGQFDVFQWHGDTFDLPAGSRHLAGSDLYPNQVFAVGSAYGLQFHVEVTGELAEQWARVDAYRDALEGLYGPGADARVLGELRDNLDANQRIARTIFTAWLGAHVLDRQPESGGA